MKWDLDKIRIDCSRDFHQNDLKSDSKMRVLDQKGGKSLGVKLSNEKIEKVQEKVKKNQINFQMNSLRLPLVL